MGIYGEYRPLVGLRLFVLALTTVLVSEPVLAQSRAESPPENVQRRRAESNQRINPYWDGFILKHQGNCREAVVKLKPIAERGFGYEDAQTALGECYLQLAGMDTDGGSAPDRDKMFAIAEFQSGLDWISKASRAGHFEAQAVMIALYAAGLGPDEDKIEAAKWAHLYLTNPSRLNLGAPIAAVVSIEQIKEAMDNESWLIGKQRARDWVPLYDDTPPQVPERTQDKK
ncbi:MAG: hypothetical protein ACPH0B_06570 [Parvibaculales bacterium]